MTRSSAVVAFVVVSTFALQVRAQPAQPAKGTPAAACAPEPRAVSTSRVASEARAEALFTSGEKKFDSGDFNGACDDFGESLRLGPKLGTLLNLALCHEQVGKLVTAWSEFSHASAWAAQNNQRDRVEFAKEHIRVLEPKLPRIVLQFPAERPISSIDLDGEPVPEQRWYLPHYLDIGEHRLAVSAPGKKRTTVVFRVSPAPNDQVIMLPEQLPDDNASYAPTTKPSSQRPTAAYVLLGIGGAGVLAGTFTGFIAATSDVRDDVKTASTISLTSFLVGAGAGILGGWILWRHATRRVAAYGGPGTLGVEGTF